VSFLRKIRRLLDGSADAASPVRDVGMRRTEGPGIGNTEPLCPHCRQRLEKMPARKKKCPGCGEFIYVRTRPADRAKVLVTEAQAAVIEQQWIDHHSEQENARLRRLPGYEQARTQLLHSLSREPTEHEVVLELANRELTVHRAQQNWGLYRNAKLQIANELRTLDRTEASLTAYLEVCYLDLNGPENMGGMDDPGMSAEFPPFRPGDAWLSPSILSDILEVQQNLGLGLEKLRGVFLSTAVENHKSLRLPVSPEAAWQKLERELIGTND
jgi:hypothetical protein